MVDSCALLPNLTAGTPPCEDHAIPNLAVCTGKGTDGESN